MEHALGGGTAEPATAEEIRSALGALNAEERSLLSQMDRWAALFPDPAVGKQEATRIYLPKVIDVRIKRSRIAGLLKASEADELRELRARLGLPAMGVVEEIRPGTPKAETPAVSD